MKRLIKGGTVVGSEERKQLDILIDGEKIEAVGENLSCREAEIVDASGKLVFPGFIDAHTHMALEVSGTITTDRFDTGTKAELAGGTTCIVDFATQYTGETMAEALKNWHEKADGQSSCDYAFHLALSEWNDALESELAEIAEKEISSFKLYMTYDNRVDDETMYRILHSLKKYGALVGVHCENDGIIKARLSEIDREKGGRSDVSDYPWSRPEEAEAEAVSRLLKIAKCVATPVIVVHLSTAAGYREIERARAAGQTVYVETCPQYLVMNEDKYFLPAGEARKYMIAPPLRKKEDSQLLWEALQKGTIDTVSTDHCSFTQSQKDAGEGNFSKTPCGMPGAEERPALLWQFGVQEGRLTPEQMCKYLSENPAKLYHLYPQKGVIRPGSDADLVIWNPQTEWVMSAEHQQSACDYCPMEGTKIKGRAEAVYLRGTLAAQNGEIIEQNRGRYVKHGTKVGREEARSDAPEADPEKEPRAAAGAPKKKPAGKMTAKDKKLAMARRKKKVAVVHCSGDCKKNPDFPAESFSGDCVQALSAYPEGITACKWSCLGLGSCAAACRLGAITTEGLHAAKIDWEKCVGCGLCVKTCPKDLISLVPVPNTIYTGCVNEEPGAKVRKYCDAGCIGCGICVKNCPVGAIRLEDGHAVIDNDLCIACGMCAVKCPRGIIHDRNGIMDVR